RPVEVDGGAERAEGAVAAERFGLLQALLAYLLDACGEEPQAVIPASDLVDRFQIPPESIDVDRSLFNLVNFRCGCTPVYGELEYQKENQERAGTHVVEPHRLERSLPHWYVHTWDRTRDAERSFRLDRMRSARLLDESFERRQGFELRPARRPARILYLPGED